MKTKGCLVGCPPEKCYLSTKVRFSTVKSDHRSSPRNVLQISSQTPSSSQHLSRRQHGNFGSNGSIFSHWVSVSSTSRIAIGFIPPAYPYTTQISQDLVLYPFIKPALVLFISFCIRKSLPSGEKQRHAITKFSIAMRCCRMHSLISIRIYI